MPGTFCPKNNFGLLDYGQLALLEAPTVHRRQIQLEEFGMSGNFDTGHLRKIHWSLFRDVYPWAGELRRVGMSKPGGAPFAFPEYIESSLVATLSQLKNEDRLRGLGAEAFSKRAAHYLAEINAIHPFREGNGRTQREFIRQLGLANGFVLSWEGLSREENTEASIRSHTVGDNSGLARLLRAAIVDTV